MCCVRNAWEGKAMKIIKLEELEPGMVLARDVKGRFGRGLLLSGNMVTEKHIKIFQSWGITEVIVEKKLGTIPDELKKSDEDQESHDRQEAQLLKLFKFNDDKHPAVRELFQVALKRKVNFKSAQEQ